MNSHLNIFNTYTNSFRTFQLENDLTRALAISLQEDSLFFHELLKEVFFGTHFYNQLFDSLESEINISIDIQKRTTQISDYEHIFAITLSEAEIRNFWETENSRNYDPICDLVIKINNVYLIIEAKRDNFDCTAQLYNQILNIINFGNDNKVISLTKENYDSLITPLDLNWSKLMGIAVRVLSFEKTFGNTNRFLADFVSFVKSHNYRWLPESPINSLQFNKKESILRRIDTAIIEASKSNINISKLHYNDRLAISFSKDWALCPGNTKRQGEQLFKKNPIFSKAITLLNDDYPVTKTYHIKFTSFQKYFTGLWFSEKDLKNELYTLDNFYKFTGRKKKGKDWEDIDYLLDDSLSFDWKNQCKWNELIINSGKSQFDISFGYEIKVKIPFDKLKQLDSKQSDLNNLIRLIDDIYQQFSDNLINNSTF